MENVESIEKFNKAYKLCLDCKYQESYDLIEEIAKKYNVPFYALLCLNLERYGYYKHLDKSNLVELNDDSLVTLDADFREICEKAKIACDEAYDFTYNMALTGVLCEQDPNALVDLNAYQQNLNEANYYMQQAENDFTGISWGLARKYIIKALRIFSGNYSTWVTFANTYLYEPVSQAYMQGYVAIKRALELEEEFLNEESGPWAIHDFDLHYVFIKYMIALYEFGLFQPDSIKKELKILESCTREWEESIKLEELKNDFEKLNECSIFSYVTNLPQKNESLKEDAVKNRVYQQSQSSSQSGGGCYIATAIYGSYDCPEVWTLRRYRDYTLAETWYGKIFIKFYYAVSPTLVKWFGNECWFKMLWKKRLDKIIASLQEKGVESSPYEDRF